MVLVAGIREVTTPLATYGYTVIAGLIGYLLGSVPYGYLIGRLMGRDLMNSGSKSTGATNALRTLGPGPAILTLVLDAGKAVAGVLIAKWLLSAAGPQWQNYAAVAAALAVIIGHSWSVFLGFRGGKSVAASAGAAGMLIPNLLPWGLVFFIVTIVATRFVSLGSLLAALAIAVGAFVLPMPTEHRVFAVVAVAIIVYRHRPNIERLLAGTESRIGQKAKR